LLVPEEFRLLGPHPIFFKGLRFHRDFDLVKEHEDLFFQIRYLFLEPLDLFQHSGIFLVGLDPVETALTLPEFPVCFLEVALLLAAEFLHPVRFRGHRLGL